MNNQPRGELVPGGLAMVIGSISHKHLIGRSVRLIEFIPAGQYGEWQAQGCGRTVTNVSTDDCWLCEVDGKTLRGVCLFIPGHLLPINPSADPLEITQQQEVEA